MSDNERVVMPATFYEKVELIVDGGEIQIWCDTGGFNEDTMILSRVDAKTLGQLLIRFANTGTTRPEGMLHDR